MRTSEVIEHLEYLHSETGDFRIPYQEIKRNIPNMTIGQIKRFSERTNLFINYRAIELLFCYNRHRNIKFDPQVIVLNEKRRISDENITRLYPINYHGQFNPESKKILFYPVTKKCDNIANKLGKSIKKLTYIGYYVSDKTDSSTNFSDNEFKLSINFDSTNKEGLTIFDKFRLLTEFTDDFKSGRLRIFSFQSFEIMSKLDVLISRELVRQTYPWENELA